MPSGNTEGSADRACVSVTTSAASAQAAKSRDTASALPSAASACAIGARPRQIHQGDPHRRHERQQRERQRGRRRLELRQRRHEEQRHAGQRPRGDERARASMARPQPGRKRRRAGGERGERDPRVPSRERDERRHESRLEELLRRERNGAQQAVRRRGEPEHAGDRAAPDDPHQRFAATRSSHTASSARLDGSSSMARSK